MLLVVLALAVVVGLSLGLLGGGGSILAVPLLVYVAGLGAPAAVATSLFVVGTTSAIAVLPHAAKARVHWRTGLLLAGGGMAGAYLGGRLAIRVPGAVLLVAFAAMMLATASAMLRGRRERPTGATRPHAVATVALGALVGTLTGFVGAGGGFLIVPALTLVAGLTMTSAIGTSLLVITLQSMAGLLGHLHGTQAPWGLALAVTGAAVVGSLIGARLAGRVSQPALRRGFGVMVLVMGALVMAQQLPSVLADLQGSTRIALLVAAALAVAVVLTGVMVRRRVSARRQALGNIPHGVSALAMQAGPDSALDTTSHTS
jgi:uncharacterized membrane protein YfcA